MNENRLFGSDEFSIAGRAAIGKFQFACQKPIKFSSPRTLEGVTEKQLL